VIVLALVLFFSLPLALLIYVDSRKREERRDAAVVREVRELRVLKRELKDLIETKREKENDQK
jgi:hypothetical protein